MSTVTEQHDYIYASGKLLRETVTTTEDDTSTTETLDFFYDANGTPYALKVNGTTYYYVTNLQGDVVQLVNSSGTAVAFYEYDPYGNIVSQSGALADTNPLRYRGYYYDMEAGFYYLQSRYYDPEIGRFINADSYASTGQGILGYNMFAYCGNNPVNASDPTGEAWWHWAVAVAVVAVAAVAVVATAGGAAAAIVAVTSVANGIAASSTAATVAAGVFVGSSAALAVSAYSAGLESDSAEEFAEYGESALYSTMAGGTVGGMLAYGMDRSQKPSNCFVEGTGIQTEDGTVPIENVKPGDMVWAWDEDSGDVALKRVVETYINESSELIHIFVDGEEIITTPTHPFYSPVKGWTDAVRLRAGDILVLVNGEYVVVEKVQHEILEAPVTVYNFQVEGYHTYYVSNSGVLVHNKCAANGYQTPKGGGGVSDTVQVGDTTVTFGHGGRHLDGTRFTTGQVNPAIANDVVSRNLAVGQFLPNGMVNIDGTTFSYTAKKISALLINVGTYHPI